MEIRGGNAIERQYVDIEVHKDVELADHPGEDCREGYFRIQRCDFGESLEQFQHDFVLCENLPVEALVLGIQFQRDFLSLVGVSHDEVGRQNHDDQNDRQQAVHDALVARFAGHTFIVALDIRHLVRDEADLAHWSCAARVAQQVACSGATDAGGINWA